ncbi:SGD1 [Candida oxycetoniae]|uniref:SGD1 n=1 Tax=Candida oxycetoniae TaxID=497107 RepID=A0AAI9WX78_9ASCO|nr:SGD1 [Candida oxycetoniae]KAI3403773.2 SGD1 [Candida oxycetoniae]
MRLPTQLLEKINAKEANGEYDSNDSRYIMGQIPKGHKRKRNAQKPLCRKEKRKEERLKKKQKQHYRAERDSVVTRNKPVLHYRAERDSVVMRNKPVQSSEDDPLQQLRKLKEAKRKLEGNVSRKGSKGLKAAEKESKRAEKEQEDKDDPLVQLKKLKGERNKNGKREDIRIVKEEDLDKDDELSGDEFSEDVELSEEEEFSEDVELSEEEEFSPGETTDPLETLRLLKMKKLAKRDNDDGEKLRIVKEEDLDDEWSSMEEDEEEESEFEGFDNDVNKTNGKLKSILKTTPMAPRGATKEDYEYDDVYESLDDDDVYESLDDDGEEESESDQKHDGYDLKRLKGLKTDTEKEDKFATPDFFSWDNDDNDIEYYAKKLGLKKNDRLPKGHEDDGLDDLLEGLDFSFDTDSKSNTVEDRGEVNDVDDSEEEDSIEEDSEEEEREKENPYVAPGGSDETDSLTQKYVPPALRRKMALETSNGDSADLLNLRKLIKGPLNKLSEANINTVVNDLQTLFMSHPRQVLNEEITKIILDSIIQQGRLLDTFVYLHATVVVALYRLQGVEFGAYFIQRLVEKFKEYHLTRTNSKEASNIISLLSSVYLFHLVSSRLLYDLIKQLIINLNESNADLLLRLIQSSGNLMRSDDPTSLKDIVLLLNEKYASLPSEAKNTRIQFLVETISSLKNNKLKVLNEGNHQLSIRLKKFLGHINNNLGGEPIQASLEDIESIETRGKWWLVGSAWKGHDSITTPGASNDSKSVVVDQVALSDILDTAEPNWMALAKAQRMNTDIRRAIFISIMSATDYIDAKTKLDKLALKRAQERDIPKVLIHCATMEPSWNPYYAILANKLCDSHSLKKTFQFMLWDLIKELDGHSGGDNGDDDEEETNFMGLNDVDEETKLQKIMNLGRLYGYLLAENSLPLHSLRTFNFITTSMDSVLFAEVVFVSFLNQLGKKSTKNSVGSGLIIDKSSKHDLVFDDRLLIERVIKAKDEITLLRGLQYFLPTNVKNSDIILGRKQRMRISWGVEAMLNVIDELLKSAGEY